MIIKDKFFSVVMVLEKYGKKCNPKKFKIFVFFQVPTERRRCTTTNNRRNSRWINSRYWFHLCLQKFFLYLFWTDDCRQLCQRELRERELLDYVDTLFLLAPPLVTIDFFFFFLGLGRGYLWWCKVECTRDSSVKGSLEWLNSSSFCAGVVWRQMAARCGATDAEGCATHQWC